MNLGYVLRYWPTRSETFVAREVQTLRARGHRVDVVSMGRRADVTEGDAAALVPPHGLERAWLAGAQLGWAEVATATRWLQRERGPKEVARVLWLAAAARRLGWDHVVAHFAGEAAELAWPAAKVAGIPCAVVVHAVDLFRPRPNLPAVLAAAAPLLTVCDHHQHFLQRHYGVEARVVRCAAPLDVPRADPGAPGGMSWISVARDVPKKGLVDLAAAVRLGGVGYLRLVSDAVHLRAHGIDVGSLEPHQVPGALAAAHAFVLPCRIAPDGDRDGVPVALMEAMAAGLPVVTTAVSGIPEVVDEEVGWLVPPEDPAALAAVMRVVAASPAERARRGAAARARAVLWGGIDRQVERLLDSLGR
jgi:colanic acid/amylovoran biosynthesis glycosyltransferase